MQKCVDNLLQDGVFDTFYRFQGGSSYKAFQVDNGNVFCFNPHNHTYFSIDLRHLNYYAKKKINQSVMDLYKEKSRNFLSCPYSTIAYELNEIISVVKQIDEEQLKFECFKFDFAKPTFDLIAQNSLTIKKYGSNNLIPERVDTKKYGGGYGLNVDWLNLFQLSTFSTSLLSIKKEDVISYLEQLYSKKLCNIRILPDKKRSKTYISPNFMDPFNKYKLIDTLEGIVCKGAVNPQSELALYPKDTINRFIKEYNEARYIALDSLEDSYVKKKI